MQTFSKPDARPFNAMVVAGKNATMYYGLLKKFVNTYQINANTLSINLK
jgi:hypothetical protein